MRTKIAAAFAAALLLGGVGATAASAGELPRVDPPAVGLQPGQQCPDNTLVVFCVPIMFVQAAPGQVEAVAPTPEY